MLENASNHVGETIRKKIKYVLNNNPDLKIIMTISEIIDGSIDDGKLTSKDNLLGELTADDCVYFKYTLVEVQRSFSAYKNLLPDNRPKFSFENLKKTLNVQVRAEIK